MLPRASCHGGRAAQHDGARAAGRRGVRRPRGRELAGGEPGRRPGDGERRGVGRGLDLQGGGIDGPEVGQLEVVVAAVPAGIPGADGRDADDGQLSGRGRPRERCHEAADASVAWTYAAPLSWVPSRASSRLR